MFVAGAPSDEIRAWAEEQAQGLHRFQWVGTFGGFLDVYRVAHADLVLFRLRWNACLDQPSGWERAFDPYPYGWVNPVTAPAWGMGAP